MFLLGFSTFAILSHVAVSFAEEDPFYYVVSSFPSLERIGQDHWTLVATLVDTQPIHTHQADTLNHQVVSRTWQLP